MKIVCREAVPQEEKQAASLTDEVFEGLRSIYRPFPGWKKRQQVGLRRVVAISDGVIVGTLSFLRRNEAVLVIGLAVDSHFRRSGVARLLLDEVTRIASNVIGVERLELTTVLNTGNVPIFERLGFEAGETFTSPIFESPEGKPVTEMVLSRPIPTPYPR